MKIGLVVLLAASALVVTGANARAASTACPTKNTPNELVLAGGGEQTGQLGEPFGEPFSVALANTNGCPLTGNVAGITVHFDAPDSGASGFFPSSGSTQTTVGTDTQGVATAPAFTANDTAGAYTVDAESDYGTVDVPLWNTAAGLAAGVSAVGPAADQAPAGTLYDGQLQAKVVDASGSPVQGAAVTFTVVPGATGAAATFLGPAQGISTNADGVATAPPLLANGVAGAFMVTASTAGISSIATFTLENLQTYDSLTASTDARVARVGGRYSPLVVTVAADGRPVQGAVVSFSVDGAQGGPGATFAGGSAQASATTDANGVASSPALVAGKVAGRFSVVASTPTADAMLTFPFRALPGKPDSIVAGAASGESTVAGTRFPVRLAVTVTDADGNAVPGALVTFVAPARGPSGRFARTHAHRVTVKTDTNGVAVAPGLVANRKAGGYAVKAVVDGKSTGFALVNLPRA